MNQKEFVDVVFRAGGIADVKQAYESVDQVLAKLEKASVLREQRAQKGRTAAAKAGAHARSLLEKRSLSDQDKAEKEALQHTMRFHHARDEIAKRSAKKRKDAELDLLRDLEKIEKEHTDKLKQELRKREADEKAAQSRAHARRRQFASTVSGAAVGSMRGLAGSAMHYGGMALTMGGALSVGMAANRAMNAESASIGLANSMFLGSSNQSDDARAQRQFLADPKNGKFVKNGRFDPKALLDLAGRTQAVSGIDKDVLASGWQDYIAKSADWKAFTTKEGQQTLIDMAKLSKAEGADFGQVMNAAGSLRVQNPDLSAEEMRKMMLAILGQGKIGAVEMKDLAAHASVITAGAGAYGMKQADAQKMLLGLSQIAIQTSGSPAEAATAVARFTSDIQAKAKKAKKSFKGFDVFEDEKKGTLKSADQILANIYDVTKGNTTLMGEGKGNIGLGRESIRLAQALNPTYRSAVENAKAKGLGEDAAHKAGVEAVRKQVQRFSAAGYAPEDVEKDLAIKMASTQERFDKVTRDLMEKLETRVTPFLEKLAVVLEKDGPEIERFMDAMAKVATWLAENPWKGLGAVIAGKITADIGSAMLSRKIQDAITNLLSRGGGGGLPDVPGGSGAGVPALGGTSTLARSGIALGMFLQAKSLTELGAETVESIGSGEDAGAIYARNMRSGNAQKRDEAARAIGEAREQASGANVAMAYLQRATSLAAGIANPTLAIGENLSNRGLEEMGLESSRERTDKTIRASAMVSSYDEQSKALDRATTALHKFADAATKMASDPKNPSRNGPMQPLRGH